MKQSRQRPVGYYKTVGLAFPTAAVNPDSILKLEISADLRAALPIQPAATRSVPVCRGLERSSGAMFQTLQQRAQYPLPNEPRPYSFIPDLGGPR